MKVSDNKEEVEKQANYDIITACEIQKSAKLAGQGLYREAQAQAHVARKYLKKNKKVSYESYQMFNNNMNVFNQNLDYNYKNNMDEVLSDDEELKEEKKECKKNVILHKYFMDFLETCVYNVLDKLKRQ